MKLAKKACLLLIIPLLAFVSAHKYYVSVTQVEYKKDKQSVQIISRIFIDDFEKLIRKRYDKDVTLDVENEPEIVNYYIEKYLSEKIHITINDKVSDVIFVGKEYEDDIVYCYLEIENVPSIISFEISNLVFFDLYDEQQNIVRTNINGKNKSFILIKENDKGLLNFN